MKQLINQYLVVVLSVVMLTYGMAASAQDQAPPSAGKRLKERLGAPIQGLWVWRAESIAASEDLMAFCREHGFNRLLVQIHTNNSADGRLLRYPEELRKLLILAAAQGVAVEALDGAPDMGMAENHASTLAILEAIIAFDRTLPEDARFAGMHYDIEPYVMKAWKTDQRPRIMLDILNLFAGINARLRLEAPHWTLSCDIPFWYDHKTEEPDSCIVEFLGETKNFHQHLQDLTDYIGIMSYRQKAVGENSITKHCEAELAYAQKIGRLVCPAMETGPVHEAPQTSFHGLPSEEFWRQKAQVEETLKDHPAYAGVLVHSYERLRAYLAQ